MSDDVLLDNIDYQYLSNYYNLEDIACKYGISRMEIKHSNYLKWILENNYLNNLSIKCFINALKKSKDYSEYKLILDKINFNSKINDLTIQRENIHNIDLFITFNNISIIVENKIDASLSGDDQLKRYKENLEHDSEYSKYKKIYVLLYPKYKNKETEKIENAAKTEKYICISYQDLYDELLFPFYSSLTDYNLKNEIEEYIHCLANPNNNNYGIIVTNNEVCHLNNLANDLQFIKYIQSVTTKKSKIRFKNLDNILHKYQRGRELEKITIRNDDFIKYLNIKSPLFYNGNQYSYVDYVYYVLLDLIKEYNITNLHDLKIKDVLTKCKNNYGGPILSSTDNEVPSKFMYKETNGRTVISIGKEKYYYKGAIEKAEVDEFISAVKKEYRDFNLD